MKIFLSFDFYGSGNIGDDLMLEGFLNVVSKHLPAKLFCIIIKTRQAALRYYSEKAFITKWKETLNQELVMK
ncbi:hypothetical protein GMMP15_730017 [Candidatus Magnetomoraceae bacterium gMMP-15]